MFAQKVTGNRNDDFLGNMKSRSGDGDWFNETEVQSKTIRSNTVVESSRGEWNRRLGGANESLESFLLFVLELTLFFISELVERLV